MYSWKTSVSIKKETETDLVFDTCEIISKCV